MRGLGLIVLTMLITSLVSNCGPNSPNELDKLGLVDVQIKDTPFRLWLADDDAERERGLMFITLDQMADFPDGARRGMLFVFDHEQPLSFWMKNTIIPLDIAFLDASGVVRAMHTMVPLDTRHGQYPSRVPVQFAIEVNANTFSDLRLKVGERLDIPPDVLKNVR